uniref:Uncharacterized protein n=1 Tax=Magallana gigas TaxID=29159 RepID=A0A8W8MT48_MAGGI
MEFIEIERIQVEDLVENIATTIDGFFTANNTSASFRWRDFSIKSYIPYVKSGARPFICSSFCGKKVAYTTEHEVIVMDTRGKKLSGYSCSGIKPSGVSFDSDGNIIVCLSDSQPEQIKFDGTSRRSLKTGFVHFPINIIFHPEDQIKDKLDSLSSLHYCITEQQEENKRQIAALCTSKEAIYSSFANRIEEAKMYLDQAHEQWLKRFEIEYAHQTDQIEVVLDELNRFDFKVTEARSMLSSVLDNSSDKHVFIFSRK